MLWRARVILCALLYVISPIDLVPEIVFGPLGCVDDVLVVMSAIRKLRLGEQANQG